MMSAVEGPGQSIMHAQGCVHDRALFPGQGKHLGHMRGTEEGPPGLRPGRAETRNFVEAARAGDATDGAESKALADLESAFVRFDGDADRQLSRVEFYNFAQQAMRDGLEALLAGIGGGGDDDAADDAASPPPVADGGEGSDDGGTGGVAAAPVTETGGVAAAPAGEADPTGGVATPPAPEVVESGDPVFDLTLSSVAQRFVQDGGAEAALSLLEAAQGYSEAAAAA
jgi:hypothetical protein